MKLSVLMPAYNEAATIERMVERVIAAPQEKEIILVDDGSTDGTRAIIDELASKDGVIALYHERNRGKGAAVRTALQAATGDVVVVQDCDLEYDPQDFSALLAPIARGEADVVYGTRAFGSHTAYSFWYVMGNKLVTLATNVIFNCYLSDMETCYKVMRREVATRLPLKASRFDLEPEITGTLLNLGYRIYEVPISYTARSRAEGKKLTWRDGAQAVWTLVAVRMRRSAMLRSAGDQDSSAAAPPELTRAEQRDS